MSSEPTVRPVTICMLCGEPIRHPSHALPEVTALERIDGTGSPVITGYTGRLAHSACAAQNELKRPPEEAV
jgi:hypothetical protein